MTEKKKTNGAAIGLGVVCVVLAVILILMAFNYIPTISGNQKTGYLMNVGLGLQDEHNGILHITGFVVNAGTSTAYQTNLHVVAYYVSGAKAVDAFVTINNGMIGSREVVQIDTTVDYSTGTETVAASSATITPTWLNSPS